MFWVILLVVAVIAVAIYSAWVTRNHWAAIVSALYTSLIFLCILGIGHAVTEPEFAIENVKLFETRPVALEECFSKKSSDGSTIVIISVNGKDKQFVITEELPRFEELFDAPNQEYYVVRSAEASEVVLETYGYKGNFWYIENFGMSMHVLVIPESFEYEME